MSKFEMADSEQCSEICEIVRKTYSSLINAGLAMMSSDISELVLRTGNMSRNGHRLRNKVR